MCVFHIVQIKSAKSNILGLICPMQVSLENKKFWWTNQAVLIPKWYVHQENKV